MNGWEPNNIRWGIMNSNSSARASFSLQQAQIFYFIVKLKGYFASTLKYRKIRGSWVFPWDQLQRIKIIIWVLWLFFVLSTHQQHPTTTPTTPLLRYFCVSGQDVFRLLGYRSIKAPFLHWGRTGVGHTDACTPGSVLFVCKAQHLSAVCGKVPCLASILMTFQVPSLTKHHFKLYPVSHPSKYHFTVTGFFYKETLITATHFLLW